MNRKNEQSPSEPRISIKAQRLALAVLSLIAVVVARLYFNVPLDYAAEVVGFLAVVLGAFIEYQVTQSVSLSIIRIMKIFCIILSVLLIAYALTQVNRLDNLITMHGEFNTKLVVSSWIAKIKLSVSLLLLSFIVLSLYSMWKYHCLRYAEARIGVLKDIIIRVEHTLGFNDKQLKVRKEEAMHLVLGGLRHIIRLNASDKIFKIFRLFRPAARQLAIVYAVPDSSMNSFQLEYFIYPENAPDKVREAYQWIKTNYRPKMLNETEYKKLKALAIGINPIGWKGRYMNFPNRSEFMALP